MYSMTEAQAPRSGVILSDQLRQQLARASELSAHDLGVAGEQLASSYLESHGWEVVERNWFCPFGEADIIAIDPYGEYVFVEVKTRYVWDEEHEPQPELAVDHEKQERYRRIAAQYLMQEDVTMARCDVIAVSVFASHKASVRHIRYAFGCDA